MINENTPMIIMERLILRKFEETDAVALFEILSYEEVNAFFALVNYKNYGRGKGVS